MLTYLSLNIGSVLIPFLFSFHKRLEFVKTWAAFWPAVLITAGVFILWDIVYTRLGVWGFNPKYLIGIEIFSLPVEEWLFFICIPYACVFTYHCFKTLFAEDYFASQVKTIAQLIAVVFIIIGGINIGKLYTSAAFLSTAIFLLVTVFFTDAHYLGRFFFTYGVLLLPFLLINGVLTGSFIEEQVVWYNPYHNLGLRVFTIPIEDFVYAMSLILANVSLYEFFLKRNLNARYKKKSDPALLSV